MGKMDISTREWHRIFKRVPRLCVDLVIKDRRGVVLAKRENTFGAGKWNLPGGSVLFGEGIIDAVKRKAKEETGLRVKILKFLGVYEYRGRGNFGHPVSLCFLCKPIGGKLKGDEYGTDVRFFKKLPAKLWPGQINLIKGKGLIR